MPIYYVYMRIINHTPYTPIAFVSTVYASRATYLTKPHYLQNILTLLLYPPRGQINLQAPLNPINNQIPHPRLQPRNLSSPLQSLNPHKPALAQHPTRRRIPLINPSLNEIQIRPRLPKILHKRAHSLSRVPPPPHGRVQNVPQFRHGVDTVHAYHAQQRGVVYVGCMAVCGGGSGWGAEEDGKVVGAGSV